MIDEYNDDNNDDDGDDDDNNYGDEDNDDNNDDDDDDALRHSIPLSLPSCSLPSLLPPGSSSACGSIPISLKNRMTTTRFMIPNTTHRIPAAVYMFSVKNITLILTPCSPSGTKHA